MLCSRYVSFHSLLTCDKFPVRFLAKLQQNDQRTVLGKTLLRIAKECGSGPMLQPSLSKTFVKKNMKYAAVPDSEKWRPSILSELLDARSGRSSMPGFSSAEVEDMIKFVCTS